MNRIKSEPVSFQPNIQVHDSGNAWAISFDSKSSHDMKREARTLWVLKEGIKQLEIQVEGFDRLDAPGIISDGRGIGGRIVLVASYKGDTVDSRMLAECALSPWAQHHSLKAGDAVNDVAAAVRSGTTAAFMAVLPGLFDSRSLADTTKRAGDRIFKHGDAGTRGERVHEVTQSAKPSRAQRWTAWLAVGGVVLIVWVALSIFGKPAHSPDASALAATSPNMAALQLPPTSGPDAQAQVELVKSTLKSMGLDPGAGGDTGCLVQPQ